MKSKNITLWVILGIAGIILIGIIFSPHSTATTEVGVRVVQFGIFEPTGVEQKLYAPGATYFFPLFINEWYTFDTKLQNIEMTMSPEMGSRKKRDDLLFKTIDGNDISLDVIITYRINPSKAPEILQNVAPNNSELEENVVRTITRNITRDMFGELKTEDFYIAEKRTQKAEDAKIVLNNMLNRYGVIIESVLPKDYRFNDAYQQAIEDKKVADQIAERYKSEANATVEEYLQRIEQANGDVNKMIAEADGEYAKSKIAADAYYEQQEKIAKAIEAEGKAEAKGIEKMVEALNSSGGITLVKLKIAEALAGKSIYLLPFGDSGGIDLKTTDVNDLLKLYGARKLSKGPAAEPEPLEEDLFNEEVEE
ncbi:MAG: prohibitin family protein [Spirochaetales bacterium]|nr:prohibitin family protein [Spirochaetales bacterium]